MIDFMTSACNIIDNTNIVNLYSESAGYRDMTEK